MLNFITTANEEREKVPHFLNVRAITWTKILIFTHYLSYKTGMRILGITVPENKQLWVGLTTFYGIGYSTAKKILHEATVGPTKKPGDISPDEENRIRKRIETMKIEGDLKREKAGNIKRLKDIKAYRGIRHQRGLPTRGQRTKTNSRTVRGNVRKTMGSGRRKLEKK